MKRKRVKFCGAIEGSVTVRKGETQADAIARAEATLCAIMDRAALLLGEYEGHGPNIGLEPND